MNQEALNPDLDKLTPTDVVEAEARSPEELAFERLQQIFDEDVLKTIDYISNLEGPSLKIIAQRCEGRPGVAEGLTDIATQYEKLSQSSSSAELPDKKDLVAQFKELALPNPEGSNFRDLFTYQEQEILEDLSNRLNPSLDVLAKAFGPDENALEELQSLVGEYMEMYKSSFNQEIKSDLDRAYKDLIDRTV